MLVADDKNNLKANMMPTIQTDYRANAMIIMIRMVSTIRMIRIISAMILKTRPPPDVVQAHQSERGGERGDDR